MRLEAERSRLVARAGVAGAGALRAGAARRRVRPAAGLGGLERPAPLESKLEVRLRLAVVRIELDRRLERSGRVLDERRLVARLGQRAREAR